MEEKWIKYWQEEKVFEAVTGKDQPKYYYLVEFPYPSGSGLHVGHVRSYTAIDVLARKKRMEGYNVLFPIGWDAFGSPAEQYAIKNNVHPKEAVLKNIGTFKRQVQMLGISFDWKREINTSDENYYKWTQWLFLQFYKHGRAYKEKKMINWCQNCQSGLSNEEASGGVCERCGTPTTQKEKSQWILRMKDDAEDLLKGLDDTLFLPRVKQAQVNWIGKSEGVRVGFPIKGKDDFLEIFTTRLDTIYGVTFMAIAPEHPLIEKYAEEIKNISKIKNYQEESKRKTTFERVELQKDKTGVLIKGIEAINPVDEKPIPIFVADYIMMDYGTGAVMGVAGHDERDGDFAKKYNLEIKKVIDEKGNYINSPLIDGLNQKDAISKLVKHLGKHARVETNYRLQDWVFSRQRFWGEPIPLYYDEEGNWYPVDEKDLPVVLPEVVDFKPNEKGESPLSNIKEFTDIVIDGKKYFRETDTMPNWAGSSWYWLRYMDSLNDKEFASMEALKYWGQVDLYNGGMEHTTRHLLYSRYWNHYLYELGLVPYKEPFLRRISHGMVLGPDGQKMSKSKGNIINPDDVVKKYGADALRCYEMFIGDYEKDVFWSEESLNGCSKFLKRVERLTEKLGDAPSVGNLIDKTVHKVTNDYNDLKFNTAISALMILTNELGKLEVINKNDFRTLLLLLNPVAPFITEELNEKYSLGNPLCKSSWPTYDETKLVDDLVKIALTINGKVKTVIEVKRDTSKEELIERAKSDSRMKELLEGKIIKKEIAVLNKIVNFVI